MIKKTILAASVTSILAGCATTATTEIKQPDQRKVLANAQQFTNKLAVRDPKKAFTPVRFHEGNWIFGGLREAKQKYDERLRANIPFSARAITLPQIADRLSLATDLKFKLSEDLYRSAEALKAVNKPFNEKKKEAPTTAPDVPKTVGPDVGSVDSTGSAIGVDLSENAVAVESTSLTKGLKNPITDKIKVIHRGPLHRLLDEIANKYAIYWKFDPVDGQVTFYRTEKKVFTIQAPEEFDASIKANSADGDALSQQNVSYAEKIKDPWKGIEAAVKALLSPFGDAAFMPQAGQVVVKDTPEALARVSDFIRKNNEALTKPIELDVTVLSVQVENNENFSLSFKNLIQKLSKTESIGFDGGLVGSGIDGALTGTLTSSSSQLTGSAIVEALSKRYEVSLVQKMKMRGVNRQVIKKQIVDETSYISDQTFTNGTDNTVATSGIKTSVKTTGVSLALIPKLIDKKRVALTVSIEISRLQELRKHTGSLVETPITNRKTIMERVVLNSHETAPVAVFENKSDRDTRAGVGSETFWGLGGGKQDSATKEYLVVLVTPVI